MNTVLWIAQGLLTLVMLLPGIAKLTNSNEQLKLKGSGRMDWTDDISATNVKLIGVVEVLIGLGLILPMLLDIQAWLTPLAAIGAICTMLGAIILHFRRKDGASAIVANFVILLIAVFVAYGRFGLFNT